MTKHEHLLTILAEECAEVAQRASKALRFGLTDVEPGQQLNNAERLKAEFADLFGTYGELVQEGLVKFPTPLEINTKRGRIAQFLQYSAKVGTLTNPS